MKQLVGGMVLGGALVAAGAVAFLTWPTLVASPAERLCAHSVEVCGTEDPAADEAACVEDLEPWLAGLDDRDLERLTTCVMESDGCARVQGCFVGAGLEQTFGEVGEFFQGMGKALGIGGRNRR